MGTATVIMNVCDGVSDQVAVEAAMAEREWTAALGAVTEEVADCFERREPRAVVQEMTEAMLVELDTRNCWTLAEALGHRGSHRLQHLLSRAAVGHDRARVAAWAACELTDRDVVLIVDETGDERSFTGCVGAARQYSGALGGMVRARSPSTSPTRARTGTPRSTGPCTSAPSGPPTRNDACSPMSPTRTGPGTPPFWSAATATPVSSPSTAALRHSHHPG